MNYELAKELKDAGLPQTSFIGGHFYSENGTRWQSSVERAEMTYGDIKEPTLSELIEAVRSHPMNRKDIGLYTNGNGYTAWARKTHLDGSGDGDRDCQGETPEEAVANLYLALYTPEVKEKGV